MRLFIIGFWSGSNQRGGRHSGNPPALIRQIHPRLEKLWWW